MDNLNAFGSCPRCGHGTDFRGGITVCGSCGWMPEKKENHFKLGRALFAFSVVAGLAFAQMVHWGTYSVEIVPLKLSSTFGMASAADYTRISEICEKQLKWDCAAEALNEKAWLTSSANDFKALGDLYRRMSKWTSAVEAYDNAISKLSDEQREQSDIAGDAYYGLAKAHEMLNQVSLAESFYEKSIEAKPEVLQVTVTADYAKMLKNAGRVDDAKRVIASAEKRSNSKGRFDAIVDL